MKHAARYIAAALLLVTGLVVLRVSPERFGAFPANGPDYTKDSDADYSLGRVDSITEEGTHDLGQNMSTPYQKTNVSILSGSDRGQTKPIEYAGDVGTTEFQKVHAGEYVVIATVDQAGEKTYYIADSWRLSPILAIALFFLALAILFGGRRGALAVIGCAIGFWMLVSYMIPAIIHGTDPFLVSIIGTVAIATVTMLVSHGVKLRTWIALGSTIITLIIAAGLAKLCVDMTILSGAGTEDAFFLKFGALGALNLRGLLLAGIMVGVLGVLNDVTTAQAAAVEELKHANHALTFAELFTRGSSIGGEHIASLVNTLVLAYAGASFPLFLLFSLSRTQPLWVLVNSEFLAEEIVRTLIGSAALVLAVPLTTLIAAWIYSNRIPKEAHGHHH